jgi:hypothetical protein
LLTSRQDHQEPQSDSGCGFVVDFWKETLLLLSVHLRRIPAIAHDWWTQARREFFADILSALAKVGDFRQAVELAQTIDSVVLTLCTVILSQTHATEKMSEASEVSSVSNHSCLLWEIIDSGRPIDSIAFLTLC